MTAVADPLLQSFRKMRADFAIIERADACRDPCHVVEFNPARARVMLPAEVRKLWPRRVIARCPTCEFSGVAYASFEHYVAGNW